MKTLALRDIVDTVKNSGNQHNIAILQKFLDEKPILSNYLIERKFTLFGLKPFVVELLNVPRGPSLVPFYDHIAIPNLTPECKLTLSEQQVAFLANLIRQL